jgi:hypothetical protein
MRFRGPRHLRMSRKAPCSLRSTSTLVKESTENENNAPPPSSERSSNLKFIALLILVAGFGLAAFLYPHRSATTGDGSMEGDPVNGDAPLSLQDSRRDSRELEVYNGKLGVLVDKWVGIGHAWMQPKPLAITIALASGIVAFGVFTLASRPPGKARR